MPILATNFIQDAFSPLISVFKAIMVFLHDNVTGGSWGLAIIGLTIVVRAALVPLTVKQFSSMAKLQALGPEIKALQARFKDDKQRLNEEMMKFYKENQVNPFGSCLPLVLQFPVFISLFYMLRSDLKVQICGHALTQAHVISESAIQKASCQTYAHGSGKFLFIPDITASAHGVVLVVLIVLYIGSQLVSSLLTTATVDRNQRLIALGLPFVFTIFIISFPAGLILYWITTNLWTVGQQTIVRKYFPPPNLAGAGADAGKLSLSKLWSRGGDDSRPDKAAAAPPAAKGSGKTTPAGLAKAKAKGNGGRGPSASTAPTRKTASATATKKTASAAPTKKTATAVKAEPRRKGGGPTPASNGRAGAKDAKSKEDAKPAATPRPRGSAPPPPPRKKKKRSGRRR
ncbi:MAG: membrane protein insertase YidC [Solirubrobacteraceae bacterium]